MLIFDECRFARTNLASDLVDVTLSFEPIDVAGPTATTRHGIAIYLFKGRLMCLSGPLMTVLYFIEAELVEKLFPEVYIGFFFCAIFLLFPYRLKYISRPSHRVTCC